MTDSHQQHVRGLFRKRGKYAELPRCERCKTKPIYHHPTVFPDGLTLDLCKTCQAQALKEGGS